LGDCRASHFGYVSVSVEDEVKSPKPEVEVKGYRRRLPGEREKL